jgi:hypothetical protein
MAGAAGSCTRFSTRSMIRRAAGEPICGNGNRSTYWVMNRRLPEYNLL